MRTPTPERCDLVGMRHLRARRLAPLLCAVLLAACDRAPEVPAAPVLVAASAPAVTAAPAAASRAGGESAPLRMFHLGLASVDITRRIEEKERRGRRFFEIPGLLVPGPGTAAKKLPKQTYSGGFKQDVKPLAAFPNAWLLSAPGGGVCVATAVGPKTLLTAAHCVQGEQYELHHGSAKPLTAVCISFKANEIPTDSSDCSVSGIAVSDLAVCTVQGNVNLPNGGAKYETLESKKLSPNSKFSVVTFLGRPPKPESDSIHPIELKVASWPAAADKATAKSLPSPPLTLFGGDSGSPWMAPGGMAGRVVAVHVCGNGGLPAYGVALNRTEVAAFLDAQGKISPICGVTPGTTQLCR